MSIQSIGSQTQFDNVSSSPAPANSSTTTGAAHAAAYTSTNPTSSTPSTAAPNAAQLSQAVHDINKSVQSSIPGLEFSMDTSNTRMVVKVVDQSNNQVIMQIPNEDVIQMSQSLEKLQGLLIKLKA